MLTALKFGFAAGNVLQKVEQVLLVNALTKVPIQVLQNGATINLPDLPTDKLALQVITNPVNVGSVLMEFTGNPNVIENTEPYIWPSDANNIYTAFTPAVGSYTFKSTPYSSPNAEGFTGPVYIIGFTIINNTTNPDPTPTIATLADLITYSRAENTAVRVTDPVKGDYFDYVSTSINPADNIMIFAAVGGGFWIRRTTTVRPELWNVPLDGITDSTAAWRLVIAAAIKYKKNILYNSGASLLLKRTDGTTPLSINADNIRFLGRGKFLAKVYASTEKVLRNGIMNYTTTYYKDGYKIIDWSGNNGYAEFILDGAKDNSQIDNFYTPVSSLMTVSGSGFTWAGKHMNAQGYGVNSTGDFLTIDSLEVNHNPGYAGILVKAFSNHKKWHIKNFRNVSESRIPAAKGQAIQFNTAYGINADGSGWIYTLDEVFIDYAESEGGGIGFESVVESSSGSHPAGGMTAFKNIYVNNMKLAVSKLGAYTSGAIASMATTKNENVDWYHILGEVSALSDIDNVQGIWWSGTKNGNFNKYTTNNFQTRLPSGITKIKEFRYVRRNANNPTGYKMFDYLGPNANITIDRFIMDDLDYTIPYNSGFVLFNLTNRPDVRITIGEIISTRNNGYKLSNVSSAQNQIQFQFVKQPGAWLRR